MKNRLGKIVNAAIISCVVFACQNACAKSNDKVEQWKIYELTYLQKVDGNPFEDVELSATFFHDDDTLRVKGFYDGDGIFKVRFMPGLPGKWTYRTSSNIKKLNDRKGGFECYPAQEDNHGPVTVDSLKFVYADGTGYIPVGTTCYAWVHQPEELKRQTVETLKNSCFNKIRMCVFPKSYDWNHNEPEYYPFEGNVGNWDFSRFNPEYFRNIEKSILAIDSLGIEADIIVFHPYDRWGFSSLALPVRDKYMQYLISRLAAFKNVWWSMANEYDFMNGYDENDWKHHLEYFAENDPYNHLRSIHNGVKLYDHNDKNVTHVSIQASDTHNGRNVTNRYHKPVIYDECRYEGNIPWSWGTLSGEEMVEKFWNGFLSGAFVGHGEVLLEKNDKWPWESDEILWWAKGGKLKGKSHERIKFLKEILEAAPENLTPDKGLTGWQKYPIMSSDDDFYLLYFGRDTHCQKILDLPKDKEYKIELIDTWNMDITPIDGTFSGQSLVKMPENPYMALRIISVK